MPSSATTLRGVTKRTHWIGVFLLFVSTILLLVTTISAPVTRHLSLLQVEIHGKNGSSDTFVTFGTFGYCADETDHFLSGDKYTCTKPILGYAPAQVVNNINVAVGFGPTASSASDGLTRAMVLHPIACGLTFIAFCLALVNGLIGSLGALCASSLAWILTLAAVAADFSVLGLVHHEINKDSNKNAKAHFGAGIWTLAVAFVFLAGAVLLVGLTFFSVKRENQKLAAKTAPPSYEMADY